MTTKKSASTKAAPAAKVTEQVEAAVTASKETVEAAVKAGTDVAAKSYEKAVAMTQEQVDAAVKAGTEVFQNYEDIVTFNKDNVDAVMQSGSLLVKGVQDINKVMFGLAQASMEDSVAATKALFGCTSFAEAIKVQSDFAKSSYDKAVTESRKLTDLSAKVAETAAGPLGARVEVALEKFTKPLAA